MQIIINKFRGGKKRCALTKRNRVLIFGRVAHHEPDAGVGNILNSLAKFVWHIVIIAFDLSSAIFFGFNLAKDPFGAGKADFEFFLD